ncbi:DUF6326 family protein [Longispora urticae]
MRTPPSGTALENAPSRSTLEDPRMPVRAKLTAAWTSFMFLYLYVDFFNLYKPGVVDGILNGLVWKFEVTSTLLTIMLASVAIPALMVTLSMTLPARASRTTNLVVASLYLPYSAFNAAGTTREWAFFYGLSIGLEVLLLAFILRSAWTWPRRTAQPH